MNTQDKKILVSEDQYEHLKRVYNVNLHSLINVDMELNRVQSTKAWKVMCLMRRVKEQLLKGSTKEKKKFYSWAKNKLLNKPIHKELELAQFNPISPVKIYREEFTLQKDFITSHDSTPYSSCEYINYNMPTGVDILRFPVIEWDFRWQRPQQISVQFANNGHRVFYFSIDTLEIQDDDASYEEISEKIICKELQPNVWWVKLCSHKRLNAYKDVIQDEQDIKYLLWSIDYLKNKFSFTSSVSILDLPFWAPLAFKVQKNTVIYDCMDDHAGFSTNSTTMLQTEEQLIKTADVVITSSQRLFDKVKDKNEHTLLIRNAGEFKHFAVDPKETPEELVNIRGPIIGYYGAISEWFDISLIKSLAAKNKQWTFLLIGDTFGCDITETAKLPNVIFTGEKPYYELPKYLHKFDVCLIPFLKIELTLATNPVKIYEYLAAGKPVVSIDLPEVALLGEIVSLANDEVEFEAAIKKSLEEKSDSSLIKERKNFSSKNTWENRYKEIKAVIDKQYYPKVSIVIVTYNNWSFTKQCLESLFKNSQYPNMEIIIVDNASTDETRIQLSRIIHPQLKLILSPTNTGFAGGNSLGCQASTGDYIILLNNDTILPKEWIERLIKPLKENLEIGIVGPMSNSVGNDQILDHFIGDPVNGPDLDWLDEFYQNYHNKLRYTDLLGFYCVAMKREVYEKVGDLDTAYGIGMFEDDDYCERIKASGYKLAIVEDAFVYHHGSVSFKKLEDDKYKSIFSKNKNYFEQKWNKAWSMPKNPFTLFFNALDVDSVSQNIRNSGLKSIVILGEKDWGKHNPVWQQFAKKMSQEGYLVICYTHSFHGKPLIGNRKIGPNLYLTNRIDLFEKAPIDVVAYCGETVKHHFQNAETIVINKDSYTGASYPDISNALLVQENILNFVETFPRYTQDRTVR